MAKLRPDAMMIFDCNGVLVDSEPIATAVTAEALESVGITVSPDVVARYFTGRRPHDMFSEIEAASGVKLPDGFAGTVAAATLQRLRQELKAIPHVAHALTWLRGPKCVASSSGLDRVKLCLEATDLARFFGERVFSAMDVAEGKPSPQLFLHVAARMGIEPKDCIVVEDSPAGVSAAMAAGMMAIGFVGGTHGAPNLAGKLSEAGARSVIADMRALKAAVTELRGY